MPRKGENIRKRKDGSGGRFIGEEVAKKLGIAYYDKEMIGQIAEQAGLSSELASASSPSSEEFSLSFSLSASLVPLIFSFHMKSAYTSFFIAPFFVHT